MSYLKLNRRFAALGLFMSGVRSGVNGAPNFCINDARYDGSWELPPLLAAVQALAGGRAR